VIKTFAEENNLPFKLSGVIEITLLNYDVMRRFASESEKTTPKPKS
jgi:hypothetical protein